MAIAILYDHMKYKLFKICAKYGGVQKVNGDEDLLNKVIKDYQSLPNEQQNIITNKTDEEIKHFLQTLERVYLEEEEDVVNHTPNSRRSERFPYFLSA